MSIKPYDLQSGPKHEIRQTMASILKDLTHRPKVLTLPDKTFHCYDAFRQARPDAEFVMLERDHATWLECIKVADVLHQELGDWVRTQTPQRHVDLAYMDFLSWCTSYHLECLRNFLRNPCIVHAGKPTYVGLTFMVNSRVKGNSALDGLLLERTGPSPRNVRVFSDDHYEKTRSLVSGVCYEAGATCEFVHDVPEYQCAEGKIPMMFMLIRAVRR